MESAYREEVVPIREPVARVVGKVEHQLIVLLRQLPEAPDGELEGERMPQQESLVSGLL